jgi:hypothetical protein
VFERDINVDVDSSVAKRVYRGCCMPAWIQWPSPILLARKAELHDTVTPERNEMQLDRGADLIKEMINRQAELITNWVPCREVMV